MHGAEMSGGVVGMQFRAIADPDCSSHRTVAGAIPWWQAQRPCLRRWRRDVSHADTQGQTSLMRTRRAESSLIGSFPRKGGVSAYVGSSYNLKDLKDTQGQATSHLAGDMLLIVAAPTQEVEPSPRPVVRLGGRSRVVLPPADRKA